MSTNTVSKSGASKRTAETSNASSQHPSSSRYPSSNVYETSFQRPPANVQTPQRPPANIQTSQRPPANVQTSQRPSANIHTLSQHLPSTLDQSSLEYEFPDVHHASQHPSSTLHQPSSEHQSSDVHRTSSQLQRRSHTGRYYGPVRSSFGLSHPPTSTSSHSQQRISPYTINSPRTNRRQGAMAHHAADIPSDHFEDENIHPSRLTTVDHSAFDALIARCNTLENAMRSLQCTTDRILKIALNSAKTQEEFLTTRPKSMPKPVLWNNQNLLERPRTSLPTTYLCYLVRKMYSIDEIKNKVPRLSPEDGDDRLEKIKECLVQLYFSHNPSLILDFMATKGQDSLYSQERTQKSRDKARSMVAENENNQNMNVNEMAMIGNQDNDDVGLDLEIFNDF